MPLLADDSVTEIEVNSFDKVLAKGSGWRGHKHQDGVAWPSRSNLLTGCAVLAQASGRVVNEDNPVFDGRLPGGERLNIVVPPACADISITIRKFPAETMSLEDLLKFGAIDERLVTMFRSLVLARKNILVSGGTNSGKTSLVNALARLIPHTERIITVEDSKELQIRQPNWVSLETVQAWRKGAEDIPISRLVKNTLRQTPDRIVVGECRGEEALYLLRAFSTGHSGGFSTVHANSAADSLDQIQLLSQFSDVDLSSSTVAQLVARAVEVVIHVQQFPEDDSRKVAEIIEVSKPGVRFADGAAHFLYRTLVRYEVHHVATLEDGGHRIEGDWAFPERPSDALLDLIGFKGLEWPKESREALCPAV